MKSVLVFALFAMVAVAHANDDEVLKEQIAQITKECAEKTNFSDEGIKKLQAQDLSLTENVQCFQKCFFENGGIIKDKAFDNEKVLAIGRLYKQDEAKVKANLEKCTPLYKPDAFDCDAAWEIFKCFH
ncbi:general odorant-binding protein 56a-like [Bradysia coprophila]|uniref:general odorant-binding protein 56a-like n=1 Tax=Bradysia coprophila TaxID=38358 RepID=UPI00187D6EC2|nr:general odorant-binding protein 56a-like [Bradysia coprophila]